MPRSSASSTEVAEVGDPVVWRPPGWAAPISLLLCAAGIGVSIYLTYAHYTDPHNLACSDSGTINCVKVTTSAQSRFLGMPVSVLGLAYFVGMTALCLPFSWRRPEPLVRIARLAGVGIGIVMVLWLVYAEFVIIDAICLWCTVVHILTLLLLIVVVAATLSGSDRVIAADGYDDFDDLDDSEDDSENDSEDDALDDPAAG